MSLRKFNSNDKVVYRKKRWTVCRETEYDDNKHLCYKISRGAWKKYMRSDRIAALPQG